MLFRYKKGDIPSVKKMLIAAVAIIVVLAAGLYIQNTSQTTYAGTLPCADCVGIKTTLTLNGNHTYVLRSLYIDRGDPFTEKGTWQQETKNNMQVYVLKHEKSIEYYQIVNNNTLKMLDLSGSPIKTPFSLELKKQ